MEHFTSLDIFRPIFIFMLSVLLVSLATILFQSKQMITGFSTFLISLTCSVVSGILLYNSSHIVDKFNLAGDSLSFYLVVAIEVLCVVNIFTYIFKQPAHS
jgi:uncharacterized membrane protein